MNITRKLKGFAIVGTALVGFSALGITASAVAPTWHPQSTVETISIVSGHSLQFKDNKNNTVTCNTITASAEAPVGGNASEAQTTNSSGAATAPAFSSCSSNIFGSTASVSCTTPWDATATMLINNGTQALVDITNVACTITISTFAGTCTITSGTSSNPVSVTGNTFTNSSSQLAANSTSSFNISESSGSLPCDGATTATESGTVQVGTSAGGVTIS